MRNYFNLTIFNFFLFYFFYSNTKLTLTFLCQLYSVETRHIHVPIKEASTTKLLTCSFNFIFVINKYHSILKITDFGKFSCRTTYKVENQIIFIALKDDVVRQKTLTSFTSLLSLTALKQNFVVKPTTTLSPQTGRKELGHRKSRGSKKTTGQAKKKITFLNRLLSDEWCDKTLSSSRTVKAFIHQREGHMHMMLRFLKIGVLVIFLLRKILCKLNKKFMNHFIIQSYVTKVKEVRMNEDNALLATLNSKNNYSSMLPMLSYTPLQHEIYKIRILDSSIH
ncbi:hypothetical protein AGLY_001882 [Aphis glycines]|uniref:Uncharacterized protein n=1 Tax=Aphis glycines TaxID=307491 RepID=A0A6G0U4A0_APHGL|nr:hypothetical protein AGLY_001882 [Aphis glycines]